MPDEREGWDAAGERVETSEEYEERKAAHEVAEQGCCQTWVEGVQCNRPRYRVGSDLCKKHDTAENELAALRARVAMLEDVLWESLSAMEELGGCRDLHCTMVHCAPRQARAALAEEPPK